MEDAAGNRLNPRGKLTILSADRDIRAGDAKILVAGDLNGDNREDLLVTTPNIRAVVLARSAQQVAVLGRGEGIESSGDGTPSHPVSVGDINGDGLSDFGYIVGGNLYVFYAADRLDAASLDLANAKLIVTAGQASIASATAGDFNGTGSADLAVDLGSRRLAGDGDDNSSARTFVFFDVAQRNGLLTPFNADVTIQDKDSAFGLGRALQFDGQPRVAIPNSPSLDIKRTITVETWMRADQFNSVWQPILQKSDGSDSGGRTYSLWLLSETPSLNLNQDRFDDLVLGAVGASPMADEARLGAGRVYVIHGAQVRRPDAGEVITELANVSVPGSGSYLVDRGTGRPILFPAAPDSYAIEPGQSAKWFRISTLGDGKAGDVARLGRASLPAEVVVTRAAVGSIVNGIVREDFVTIGELAAGESTGVLQFDLGHLVDLIENPENLGSSAIQLTMTASYAQPGRFGHEISTIGSMGGKGTSSP